MTNRFLTPFGRRTRDEGGGHALSAFRDEMDRLFDDFFTDVPSVFRRDEEALWPRVDVNEEDKNFVITAELPGIDEKDVEVTLHDGALTIRGEKKSESEEKNKKGEAIRVERSYGTFQRTFTLPSDVNADKAEASYDKGILTIEIPKNPESAKAPKRISVKAG